MLALVSAIGCAVNPVTGNRELALVSEADEIAMGRAGAASIAASVGLHPDATLQAYVGRIGQEMAARSERPALEWQFHVVDDGTVNAFALPGGFIFVTRGLLTHLGSEAQLASVLGHEAGHVAARHSVQQLSRQQLASLGLGIGSAISPAVAQFGQVASAGMGLLFLKYGRDDETQADRLGYRYALSAGYDTREMVDVFRMLDRDAQLSGAGRLPQWQSTHPDPGNRIQDVQRMIAATGADFGDVRSGRDDFIRRIDGLVYGDDPRAGYFDGSLFLHPDLKFVLRFPDGWLTANAADAVRASSTEGDALIELRIAQGSAVEAARRFASQDGVTASAAESRIVHGRRAVSTDFGAALSDGSSLRGLATFIEYDGMTWAIVGFTVAERFATHRAQIQRTADSFDQLTNAAALAVQPMRVRIVAVPRTMTLTDLNVQYPSSIPLAELAVINGLEAASRLSVGQSIKRIVGTPVPHTTRDP
jgi:predicted Zn-dependent protease